jgi:hypothetical protein
MIPCGRFDFLSYLRATVVAAAIAVAAADARCQENPSLRAQGGVVEVDGPTLRVRLPDGSIREGAALVGATLVVAVGGQTLRVRIAGVEHDPRDPLGEVLLYDFRVTGANGAEEPLCTPDPDRRQLGLTLGGRSDAAGMLHPADSTTFELVCTSGAQGKCVRFGYAPWRRTQDDRPMLDWYNACVRMVRGDYCGDGRPFTRDGMWIDIYDRIGVQQSDADSALSFEAVWAPDGAICVAHTRVRDIITLDGLAKACPRLAGRLGPDVCTENAVGGLIINRSR